MITIPKAEDRGHADAFLYADGSHAGTGLQPVAFTVEGARKTVHLCACKKSGNKPYCDGSHARG